MHSNLQRSDQWRADRSGQGVVGFHGLPQTHPDTFPHFNDVNALRDTRGHNESTSHAEYAGSICYPPGGAGAVTVTVVVLVLTLTVVLVLMLTLVVGSTTVVVTGGAVMVSVPG